MTQPGYRFNPAPGWPPMPPGWTPPQGWTSPADWPAAPEGWQWWTPVVPPAPAVATYPQKMVTKSRQDTSHTFHLLMSLFTCGLWAFFVWLPIIVWHAIGPKKRTVTRLR